MNTISASALRALMDSDAEWALFDIREAGEADGGHIPGASFLPRRMLESKLADFVQNRATPLIVYDEGGQAESRAGRASFAAEAARRAGYRDVRVLADGVAGWLAAGYSVASGSNVPSKHFGEKISHDQHVPQLSAQTLQRWQAEGTPHVVVDIRTPEEYKIAHIPQALGGFGVDVGLSAADLAAKKLPIVVHCAGRTRSIIACQTLRELGVEQVQALEDGTMGWTLAGFELERGHPERLLQPTPSSVEFASQQARTKGEAAGVTIIDADTLNGWIAQRAAGAMTLYVFDVRQVPQYEAAHVPGARALPGGLAIQRTDEFIAVKNAHIVLIDDTEARGWITGWWLRRMGFPNVHVLSGGLAAWQAAGRPTEIGRTRSTPLRLDETRRATRFVTTDALGALQAGAQPPVIIDVDSSRYFGARHLPGAHWIPYGSLESRIVDILRTHDSALVVTCHNGVHSAYAAANLSRLGYTNVQVLDGGTDQWAKARLPLDTGLGDATSDDIVVPPYNSDTQTMAKYLAWEKKLV